MGDFRHVYSQVLEERARAVRAEVLELLASRNVDPATAVLALADVVALNACTTDLDTGQPRSLADRLDSFCKRVDETYRRAYPEMSARRVRAREGRALTIARG
jgi:hypothetical protein